MATKHEVIATRRTADNKKVELWDDGAITEGNFSQFIPELGRKRLPTNVRWVFIGEVELYDLAELPKLFAAARKLGSKGVSVQPGDLRAAMKGAF